eukprot:SAG31_NODE_10966_length_1078_cov_0.960163_1_plen_74_part_00
MNSQVLSDECNVHGSEDLDLCFGFRILQKIIGELAADREKIRTAREALGGLGVESYQMGKPAEYDLTNTPSPR